MPKFEQIVGCGETSSNFATRLQQVGTDRWKNYWHRETTTRVNQQISTSRFHIRTAVARPWCQMTEQENSRGTMNARFKRFSLFLSISRKTFSHVELLSKTKTSSLELTLEPFDEPLKEKRVFKFVKNCQYFNVSIKTFRSSNNETCTRWMCMCIYILYMRVCVCMCARNSIYLSHFHSSGFLVAYII